MTGIHFIVGCDGCGVSPNNLHYANYGDAYAERLRLSREGGWLLRRPEDNSKAELLCPECVEAGR